MKDENLIYCPICKFSFEMWEDYVQHRKSDCVDAGINQLIKSRCEYI